MYAKIKIGDAMKKNGFTLIEVAAVVLLLGLLSVFIVPKVSKLIANNKDKICKSAVISITDAAKNYTYKHTNEVNIQIANNGYVNITLLMLQEEGLLDNEIINPHTNESFSSNNVVKITKDGNIYNYQYMGDEC